MTFDDGKVNAISQQMIQLFSDSLDELEASEARALVLAGRPGQFCAGFDLSTLVVGGSRRGSRRAPGRSVVRSRHGSALSPTACAASSTRTSGSCGASACELAREEQLTARIKPPRP
jgi:enoyl-CoA hydratase/carnithine racemase